MIRVLLKIGERTGACLKKINKIFFGNIIIHCSFEATQTFFMSTKLKLRKYYIVDADVIESNFPDEFEQGELKEWEVIYKEEVDPNEGIYKSMDHYLSDSELTHKQIIRLLKKELKNNPNKRLDDIEGIYLWQPLEYYFTVSNFCSTVGIK